MRANPEAKKNEKDFYLKFEVENLESRLVLSATFPAYVDGVFSFGDATQDAPYGLSNTFNLESLPSADKTIYLDFDGHHSVNDYWEHDIVFPAFDRDGDASTFSDSEKIEIQKQFQNVAEDFLPFNINVTTSDPGLGALTRSGSNDSTYGVRAVNTQATDGFGDGIGGVAYLTSFRYSIDTPVFTFNKGANNGAMTNSHEVGHALGLNHDGLNGSTYHPGTGSSSSQVSWGPILGAPFYKNVTQWSNGDYAGSTATEDDLAIITNNANGVSYRADDHGGSVSASTPLDSNGTNVSGWGIIERNVDEDFLSFTTGEGNVSLNIDAFGERANLDILATLYDDSGSVIATSNPADELGASFDTFLTAGTYHIGVEGVGKPGVYSDYGSLGLFQINGTITASAGSNVGEAGTIAALTKSWRRITLDNTYVDPVIVAGPATFNEADPTTVRIRNVTSNSFDIQLDEWNYLDGVSSGEDIDYLVMESGVTTLADGTTIVAGIADGIRHKWTGVDFGHTFDASPIVVSQTVTRNGGSAVTTRQRLINDSGFTLKVQEEEAGGGHQAESVAWIAMDAGAGSTGDLDFEALSAPNFKPQSKSLNFSQSFDAPPILVASMQDTFGGNPASLRRTGLTATEVSLFVEEEQSLDAEVAHGGEVAGAIAIEAGNIVGFNATFPGEAPIGADNLAAPLTTFVESDGTFGDGVALASGHVGEDSHDDHDHDHDHDEETDSHDESSVAGFRAVLNGSGTVSRLLDVSTRVDDAILGAVPRRGSSDVVTSSEGGLPEGGLLEIGLTDDLTIYSELGSSLPESDDVRQGDSVGELSVKFDLTR